MTITPTDLERLHAFDPAVPTIALPLNTWGWGATATWGGEKRAAPVRHVSYVDGYSPGLLYSTGALRPRIYELEGWIDGRDPETGRGSLGQFRKNWEALRDRLSPGADPQRVGFRRQVGSEEVTMVGVLLEPVVPISTGPGRAEFTARYVQETPYWIGKTVTNVATAAPLSTTARTAVIPAGGEGPSDLTLTVRSLTAAVTTVTVDHYRAGKLLTSGAVDVTGAGATFTMKVHEGALSIGPHRVVWTAGWPQVVAGDELRVKLNTGTGLMDLTQRKHYV